MSILTIVVPCIVPLVENGFFLNSLSACADTTGVHVIICSSGKDMEDQVNHWSHNKIQIIHDAQRLDFSQSINRGIDLATSTWVWCLNDDTELASNALVEVLKTVDQVDPNVFAVVPSSHHRDWDGPIESVTFLGKRRGRFLALSTAFVAPQLSWAKKTPLAWAPGGVGAFRSATLKDLGGFDRWYAPMYGEDLALGLKAVSWGWRIQYCPQIKLCHRQGVSAAKVYSQFQRRCMSERNMRLALWHFLPWKNFMLDVIFTGVHALGRFLRGDAASFLAYFQSLISIPSVLMRRCRPCLPLIKSGFLREYIEDGYSPATNSTLKKWGL